MLAMRFTAERAPPGIRQLRREVRAFLEEKTADKTASERARSWSAFDSEFSRSLGARGWIGMTWPARYGGGERTGWERYTVLEELLAAGAPVGAHWIADRQSGPLLLRFGSEEQRAAFLPRIARGELYFCIGMSEPNAGSDLAALKTRASSVSGGWLVNGSKIWTTNAPHAHFMIALVRSGEASADRHQGLSQLLIDLKSPGVSVRPIADLTGARDLSEVFFQDVFVPESMLVGTQGQGWRQVTAELALERSGPERYLSSYCLLDALVRSCKDGASGDLTRAVGGLVAQLWTLRQMSMSVAAQLSEGREATLQATLVKDLGCEFEQQLASTIQSLIDLHPSPGPDSHLASAVEYLLQVSPSFSLRGGTREILRGIIARGLELR